jgi:hypothetical protein
MIRQTSILAYKEIINDGLLGLMEQRVYNIICKYPGLCDREYSELTGLRINQITGRRNDLLRKGLVVDDGLKKFEKTNKTVMTWKTIK